MNNEMQHARRSFERLNRCIMSCEDADKIVDEIRGMIDRGIIKYGDLGNGESEVSFQRVVDKARKSLQETVTHFDKMRFLL